METKDAMLNSDDVAEAIKNIKPSIAPNNYWSGNQFVKNSQYDSISDAVTRATDFLGDQFPASFADGYNAKLIFAVAKDMLKHDESAEQAEKR